MRRTRYPIRIALALLGVVSLASCEGRTDASVAPVSRAPDGLLADVDLQGVVQLQVVRDGAGLQGLLAHERAEVRARAALALASVQDPSALDALLDRVTSDDDASVRRDAALAVGQLGDGSAVASLAEALATEIDEAVRGRLLEALGKIGTPSATAALLDAAVEAGEEGRRALALSVNGAVRDVQSQDAQDFLLSRLDDADPAVRAGSAYFFGRQDDPSPWVPRVARIREALDGYATDDPAAMYLVQALGRIGQQADTDRLVRWARSAGDWRTRSNAMTALVGRELETGVAEALLAGLDDPAEHVAANSAAALSGSAQPPSVLAEVRNWIELNRERRAVVEPLMAQLAAQNEREFVFSWIDALAPEDENGWRIGLSAVAALSGRESLERLGEAVNSPQEHISSSAAAAMSQRWAADKRDPSLHDIYYGTFLRGLESGNPTAEFASAQVLTDPLLEPFGSHLALVEAYQRRLESDVPREAAEFLRLIAFVEAPGAETLLRAALEHPASVMRRIAASGLERVTGERPDVDIEADAAEVRRGSADLPYDPTQIDWPFLAALGDAPRLVFETTRGRIVMEMAPEEAPHTVQTMARLAQEGRFDGVPFHRVIPNFVAQGGDVDSGTGRGGPGFQITSEFNGLAYVRGAIGMASAGKDTEGSQFFLAHTRLPHLDGGYTVFGWIVEGLGVMDDLMRGDEIVSASVVSDG